MATSFARRPGFTGRRHGLLVAHVIAATLGVILMAGCGSDGEPDESVVQRPTPPNVGAPAPHTSESGAPGELPTSSEVTPDPRVVDLVPKRWNKAEPAPDGRSLTVDFTVGMPPCSVLGRVDKKETADTVTVTLQVGKLPGADCSGPQPLIASPQTVVVALDGPLAGRRVVDGAA
jgi:hypothetical protein